MVLRRLLQGLRKTREKLGDGLSRLLGGRRPLDEDLIEEIEELLYTADLGPTGEELVAGIQDAWKKKEITETGELRRWLRNALLARVRGASGRLAQAAEGPTVILVAGVNGSGKTTSIAKLAKFLKDRGDKVCLCAADTFRAAAVEQLTLWAERLGVDIVKQDTGADPAAVAFDAVEASIARKVDTLIVDTAGRLHTQKNLMRELEKIIRVIGKRIPEAPHETLLVLDATTGQNAIRQAEEFGKIVPIDGLILAKLDGTAKGGAAFSIHDALGIPIKFVGLGERLEDLEAFDPESFVDGILGEERGEGAREPDGSL